jgi:hypothetical protein
MYWYYKITYSISDSLKYVKTSSESCEIWLKSRLGNKWEQVDKPYPIWDENEYIQLTEDEFIHAIGTIDLDFKFNQSELKYEYY